MTDDRPSGACTVCGRTLKLRPNGNIQHHLAKPLPGQYGSKNCPGAGQPPKEQT